jgi:hypothetical protein
MHYADMVLCTQVGEFCEVHNGSKSDPCAWLCKVSKVHSNGDYTVRHMLSQSPADTHSSAQ